ncbi:hypothetical protein C8Q80DRAFT_1124092 [Daedaleopsis nitida]|nr:hypothetical protein C8Q80DRAFT_1124092 [Daedaleopsis nitida]
MCAEEGKRTGNAAAALIIEVVAYTITGIVVRLKGTSVLEIVLVRKRRCSLAGAGAVMDSVRYRVAQEVHDTHLKAYGMSIRHKIRFVSTYLQQVLAPQTVDAGIVLQGLGNVKHPLSLWDSRGDGVMRNRRKGEDEVNGLREVADEVGIGLRFPLGELKGAIVQLL